MKNKSSVLTSFALVCFGFASVSFAQYVEPQPTPAVQGQGGFHRAPNPAFEAARRECWQQVAKQPDGHPVRGSMRDCLASKGFTPPERPHYQSEQLHPQG